MPRAPEDIKIRRVKKDNYLSSRRFTMLAACARVALELGENVPSPMPEIKPTELAVSTAAFAQSAISALSVKLSIPPLAPVFSR